MTGQRIALLHFTAPPAIGGVEALLAAQAEVLHAHGGEVTVVAGSGEQSDVYRLITIPELHPDSPAVRAARDKRHPDADHPLVGQIVSTLQSVLAGQDQIWIHNAFTVYLNPCLTLALHIMLRSLGDKRWVAFCHDLSAASRYVDTPGSATLPPASRVRYAVLSTARRDELASLIDIPDEQIDVIPPPLDVFGWLDIQPEARLIACETRLLDRDLTVLLPSKLLPHKRIERAIEVSADLKRKGLDPLLLVTGAPSPHEPAVSARVSTGLTSLAQRLGMEGNLCIIAELLARIPERRTVRDLMSLCDVVLLPSAEEGYGTPINEAIALRVPVICSDIPAFHDAGGDYATYANLDDPAAVAGKLMEMASAPNVARRHKVTRSAAQFQAAILQLAHET